jgi:hypothetical protein
VLSAPSAAPLRSASCSATAVGRTLRADRSNSAAPTERSSWNICCDTADEVYPSSLAASAKDRVRTQARSVCRWTGLSTR